MGENKCFNFKLPYCKIKLEKQCKKVPECHTEYDSVCEVVPKEKCKTTHEQSCKDVTHNKCEQKTTQECNQVEDQECHTDYVEQCEYVKEPQCSIKHKKECEDVVNRVCKEVPLDTSQGYGTKKYKKRNTEEIFDKKLAGKELIFDIKDSIEDSKYALKEAVIGHKLEKKLKTLSEIAYEDDHRARRSLKKIIH